ELGGTVVGKARRRRSSGGGEEGRRASNDDGTRRGSGGMIDRLNEGVRSVVPAVRRRSSSIIKHVAAAAAGATSTVVGGTRRSSTQVVPGSTGGAANGDDRRSRLLNVAMRSKTAAAAVEGSSYEDETDAEADAKAVERAMRFWTLEFHDPIMEMSFRKHYRSWVIPRIRVGVQIQMALHLLFGSLELVCGYTAGAVMWVLALRLAIMVSLTAFSWMTLDKKFHRVMDALALGFYMLNSLLLVAIDVVGSVKGTETTSEGVPLYYFFEGRWSLPSSLLFVVVVYHISGLRYVYSNIVAWMHYLFLWLAMVSGFCCRDGFGSFFTQSSALVPILLLLSMISSNTVERQIREDFVLRCNISSEKGRADAICASMLPASVSELLKEGTAAKDVLQEWPEITILFCYITGFKELTTSCDPYDVVDFVNSLFSSFDKCTEYHHVYKLEAIDCSYLCCAGGGQEGEGENLAPHADRIWDMALTMLAVAAHGSKLPAAVGAKEPGGGAILKIGLHTGRAVGGVSGVKSYSYHLFGDTVNMASRTASTGLPGRVQLSMSTFECLSPEKQSACELRRGVAMKGKGLIDTQLASFDPDGLGQRLWRNFCRFEKMTKVYDPNFQHKGGKTKNEQQLGGISSQEGKLHMIRVKRLKFTLKGSNYEDAQNTALGDELEKEYQHQYNAGRLQHFQIFLMVAWVCVCASAYLDFYRNNSSPDGTTGTLVAIRVAVCLLLLVVLLCTRDPKFVNWIQPAGAFAAALFCFSLNALLFLVPEYHMMDMNIISLVTISLLMDLQYAFVLVVNVLDVVLYTAAMVGAQTHQGEDVVGYLLFVYGAALIGSYACNKREREFRYTYLHRRILEDNKVKAEDLLKNMFPNVEHVRALVKGRRVVDHLEDVTIMFSDLKGYTQWASEESPREVYRVLNKVYTAFDTHLDALGVYKLDTVGDAFVVVAGLDGFKSKEDHAMAMVKYAFRTLFELERIKTEEDLNFEMRVGLHTGPCIGGVIGRLKPRYLCWGRTPLISNELEAAGTPGKLLVSSATFAQLNKQVLLTRGLKFRPGDPLHVKTFDDIADEEVPTFFVEMDSITAFTILANEIAEDRAAARRGISSPTDYDGDINGGTEDGNLKKTLLGVTRLKRLFQARSGVDNSIDGGMFDSSNAVGASAGGKTNNPRRPNRLSASSGFTMTTQSAYLASPVGSSHSTSKQDPLSPTTSGATATGDKATLSAVGGEREGRESAKKRGSTKTTASTAGANSRPRLRRASSARMDDRKERQRRRSSLHAALVPASAIGAGGRASTGGGRCGARGSQSDAFGSLVAMSQGLRGGSHGAGKDWGADEDSPVSVESNDNDGTPRDRHKATAAIAGGGTTANTSSEASPRTRRRVSARRFSSSRGNGGGGDDERSVGSGESHDRGNGGGWGDDGDELEGRAPTGGFSPQRRRKRRRTGSGASEGISSNDAEGGSDDRGADSGTSSGGGGGEAAAAPRMGREARENSFFNDDDDDNDDDDGDIFGGGGRGGDGSNFLEDDDDDDARPAGGTTDGREKEEDPQSPRRGTSKAPAARARVIFSDSESDSDPDLRGGSSSGSDGGSSEDSDK
ncbi:unnamed protein product, partial [Scytosiphon promiscuus]